MGILKRNGNMQDYGDQTIFGINAMNNDLMFEWEHNNGEGAFFRDPNIVYFLQNEQTIEDFWEIDMQKFLKLSKKKVMDDYYIECCEKLVEYHNPKTAYKFQYALKYLKHIKCRELFQEKCIKIITNFGQYPFTTPKRDELKHKRWS